MLSIIPKSSCSLLRFVSNGARGVVGGFCWDDWVGTFFFLFGFLMVGLGFWGFVDGFGTRGWAF